MDRTAEFKAAVNSLLSRGQLHHTSHSNGAARRGKDAAAYQEFSRLATAIGHDINDTVTKLHKLTKCKYPSPTAHPFALVHLKNLIRTMELTHVIKQDLSRLNGQTMALQQHVRANAAKANRSTRQMDEHSANLVIILQSKLANTSMGFKEALEIRTEVGSQLPNSMNDQESGQQLNMNGRACRRPNRDKISFYTHLQEAIQDRDKDRDRDRHWDKGTGTGRDKGKGMVMDKDRGHHLDCRRRQQYSNGSSDVDPYSSSSVHRRKGINGRSDDFHGQYEEDNESAGPASMLFNQQQHAPHVEQYVQNRSTAIEAVESTLQELGGIFQQLAQMVAEQRDTVQRIEANTDDIELNINEAQNQLLRYYRNISSDRQLMIKIFLTIIFVFLVISLMS
ncbi:cis-Golgi t-SNARE syntaxin [Mortierella alpina]|nr:cis-Golgi t-SNARE syntaxin [Mortierella alpina]